MEIRSYNPATDLEAVQRIWEEGLTALKLKHARSDSADFRELRLDVRSRDDAVARADRPGDGPRRARIGEPGQSLPRECVTWVLQP